MKAQKQGVPKEEIFQFLEDVIDSRAADQVLKEMERTGDGVPRFDGVFRAWVQACD
ncbi:MAG: hypothetical protein OXH16_21485 [Gemmatimonadetes bacterium]|nr:hypothetical protein [Gemmatimonadota bacterium]